MKSAAEAGAIFPRYSESVTSAAIDLAISPSDLPEEVRTSFATKTTSPTLDRKAIMELPTEAHVSYLSLDPFNSVWSTMANYQCQHDMAGGRE